MRKLLFFLALLLCAFSSARAQDCPHPDGCVVISKGAATTALQNADTVKAQADEIKAKDQAINDLKNVIEGLKIDLAKMTGDKTGAEQMVVRLTAIVDILVKNTRPKKIGLINLF